MNILLIFLLAQTMSTPTKKATCTLDNKSYILVHKDGSYEERDDWYVECTVTVDGKVVSREKPPLAHPAEFPEAAAVAREFVKKK